MGCPSSPPSSKSQSGIAPTPRACPPRRTLGEPSPPRCERGGEACPAVCPGWMDAWMGGAGGVHGRVHHKGLASRSRAATSRSSARTLQRPAGPRPAAWRVRRWVRDGRTLGWAPGRAVPPPVRCVDVPGRPAGRREGEAGRGTASTDSGSEAETVLQKPRRGPRWRGSAPPPGTPGGGGAGWPGGGWTCWPRCWRRRPRCWARCCWPRPGGSRRTTRGRPAGPGGRARGSRSRRGRRW